MISKKKTKAHISVGFPPIVALLCAHVDRLNLLDQWGASCILKYNAFGDTECRGFAQIVAAEQVRVGRCNKRGPGGLRNLGQAAEQLGMRSGPVKGEISRNNRPRAGPREFQLLAPPGACRSGFS
jgi:hypothetical protein